MEVSQSRNWGKTCERGCWFLIIVGVMLVILETTKNDVCLQHSLSVHRYTLSWNLTRGFDKFLECRLAARHRTVHNLGSDLNDVITVDAQPLLSRNHTGRIKALHCHCSPLPSLLIGHKLQSQHLQVLHQDQLPVMCHLPPLAHHQHTH